MSSIIGVDVGTTGTKVHLFTRDGLSKGYSHVNHPPSTYPRPGFVEQNPNVWWEATERCLKQLTKSGRGSSEIKALGLTGLALTTVAADKKGVPLTNAILYSDLRGRHYEDAIKADVPRPGYGTAKHFGDLLWMLKEGGVPKERIGMVTDAIGFIAFKLCGHACFDASLMPEPQVGDLSASLGIAKEAFGVPHRNTDVIGTVSAKAASETGLPAGLPVVVGPWDGMCNIIGSGLVEESIATDVAGSTEIIAVATKSRPSVFFMPHILPGLFFTYTSPRLGTMHRWFTETVYRTGEGQPDYDGVDREAQEPPIGSNGLIFVPGELAQGASNDFGAFIGISPKHTRRDMARAVLEGTAFSIRSILDGVEEAGVPVEEVRVSGGGGRSDFWTQMKADVMGRKTVRLRELETGCLGAAMLAGVGTGLYKDIGEATRLSVFASKVFIPDKDRHEQYEKVYSEFTKYSARLS